MGGSELAATTCLTLLYETGRDSPSLKLVASTLFQSTLAITAFRSCAPRHPEDPTILQHVHRENPLRLIPSNYSWYKGNTDLRTRRVPKMPPTRSGVNDLDSDRTTETPEPHFRDKSQSRSDSPGLGDDDSDVEIVHILRHSSTVFSHPPTVPSKRKGSGPTERPCGEHVPNKKSKSDRHSTGCRSPSFTVKGKVLKPTEVFDTFWYFAAERKAIDDKRRAGSSPPWTNDPILRKYPFCNTYRVLDKGCQYLIHEVIEKGSQAPQEVTFRVLLFTTFTKIETWELLNHQLGPLTWATYSRKQYQEVLAEAKSQGVSLYTGSFIKPAPSFGFSDNFMNHLCLLEMFMENQLAVRLMGAEYLADVFEYIASFPSFGNFTTYQLILNLSYSKILNFHVNDFVVPGPGAVSGLRKMFGRSLDNATTSERGFDIKVIRWLAETQHQHFKRLGIKFSALGPDKIAMSVADIEHTLCEVDKYSRLAHPQFKGKRTEMRRMFEASSESYPKRYYMPKAWSHPDRKIPRVRPGGPPIVEKRYTIDKIDGRREGKDGVEYLVYWRGYPKEDATWEPEDLLIDDAPLAIEEYLKKCT
ncbi:hypothetical protein APHAL10511_002431 [Amanita phalloides]|nr:hypothetical protein APHAL10511_002431 [Amanita phalloides]